MNFLEFSPVHYIYLLKLTGGALSTFSDLHTISSDGFTINLVISHNESD